MSIDGKQRTAGKQSRALAITQAMRLHFLSSTAFPNSMARWGPSFPTTRAYERFLIFKPKPPHGPRPPSRSTRLLSEDISNAGTGDLLGDPGQHACLDLSLKKTWIGILVLPLSSIELTPPADERLLKQEMLKEKQSPTGP